MGNPLLAHVLPHFLKFSSIGDPSLELYIQYLHLHFFRRKFVFGFGSIRKGSFGRLTYFVAHS